MQKLILNVRIDKKLKEGLKQLAEEDNRTLSNLVETALWEYLSENQEK